MKLSPEQCADVSLDILTGFHLVDGKERMVVVEGRVEGAMNIMQVRGQMPDARECALKTAYCLSSGCGLPPLFFSVIYYHW